MSDLIEYNLSDVQYSTLLDNWKSFLTENYNQESKLKIIFDSPTPLIIDSENRRLRIDFKNDAENYNKTKSNMSSEPLSRALGSGKKGRRVLDLSAGMAIDSVFLVQLGYQVTALERNPLLYLALQQARLNAQIELQSHIEFIFTESEHYLKTTEASFDVCYFDPMFPQKKKSALPKQEMVLFKNLVGSDADASVVLKHAIESKKFKRCVVKRPVSAEPLLPPSGAIEGKMIRFDIYGG